MPTPLSAIRRWHKWWFLPIEIGALLILAGWWWYTNHSPMGRLRASGAPTTFEDLVSEPIPDEENLAAGLRDLQPRILETPEALGWFVSDLDGDRIPSGKLVEARDHIASVQDLVDEIVEVCERPRYASLTSVAEMQNSSAPEVTVSRTVSRLLSLRARLHLAEGQIDEAADVTLTALRFAKASEQEPFMIARLVACALQSIAVSDASLLAEEPDLGDAARTRIDQALASLEDRSSVRDALASERVLSLVKLSEMPVVGLLSQSSVLLVYEEALAVTETPISRWASGATQLSQRASQPLASLIVPAMQSWLEAEARVAGEAQAVREKLTARRSE